MRFDPEYHHRRSIRLRDYDYSSAGAYFCTICTRNRECLFGSIHEGQMQLSSVGEIALAQWLRTPTLRPYATLDAYVIMPNHMHVILVLEPESACSGGLAGANHERDRVRRFGNPVARSVSTIIGGFKSAVSRSVNLAQGNSQSTVWQSRFYDHIIRDQRELERIRQYIERNPGRWVQDSLHPDSRQAGARWR